MNLEGVTNKLERVVKEMEILCGIDRSAAVKAGKSTSRKQKGKDCAQKTSNSAAAASKDTAKEIMYDNVFTRVMAGRKSNNNYRPRKPNANLSEEEEDDFVDVVADATASTSNVTVLLGSSETKGYSCTPTLPWVLPMYEGMLKHLRSAQDNTKYSCICTAVAAGLEKLQNYYSKACDCQLNIIVTLLHHSLGITWFCRIDKERGSELLNATRAEVLFEHVYESYQQIHANNDESRQPNAAVQPSRPGTFSSFLDDICMANVEDVSVPEIAPESELKCFCNALKNYKGDCNAPLTWWKASHRSIGI
ncbi:hypothetical protein B0H10DRAFT_1968933 [Mycena sp. CBHHK59/15]|nr:hypothetical protein B0H10DRAFT_1968933 [Mycena sp. CBHHK59/15]